MSTADGERRPLPAPRRGRSRRASGRADGRPTVFRIRNKPGPDRIDVLKRRDAPWVRASALRPTQSQPPKTLSRHDYAPPDRFDQNRSIVRSLVTLCSHVLFSRFVLTFCSQPIDSQLRIRRERNRIISRPIRSRSSRFGFIRRSRPTKDRTTSMERDWIENGLRSAEYSELYAPTWVIVRAPGIRRLFYA
jgi:hypothetical protein